MCMCVCMCVCARARACVRERERKRECAPCTLNNRGLFADVEPSHTVPPPPPFGPPCRSVDPYGNAMFLLQLVPGCTTAVLSVWGVLIWANMTEQCHHYYETEYPNLLLLFKISVILGVIAFVGTVCMLCVVGSVIVMGLSQMNSGTGAGYHDINADAGAGDIHARERARAHTHNTHTHTHTCVCVCVCVWYTYVNTFISIHKYYVYTYMLHTHTNTHTHTRTDATGSASKQNPLTEDIV